MAVAIIAILAVIAVPNMLEAQTRSKVSRVHADLKNLATAVEAYFVDFGAYPPNGAGFYELMRPVAYIGDVFLPDPFDEPRAYFLLNMSESDPFARRIASEAFPNDPASRSLVYENRYLFTSAGPDRSYLIQNVDGVPGDAVEEADYVAWLQALRVGGGAIYDPTNGTISSGDIGRSQRGITLPTLLR